MREIAFDTAKTVLVPEDEWAGEGGGEKEAGNGIGEGAGEAYLRFCGMEPAEGETVVASEPKDGIVAVMAVPAAEWAQYKDDYERGGVVVTSPLLVAATGDGPGGGGGRKREVRIVLTRENVYMAVWEKGLKMAEALPDNSVDSLLYYMQIVGRRFNLRKFDIDVRGERAGIVADALRRYYKRVKTGGPAAANRREDL